MKIQLHGDISYQERVYFLKFSLAAYLYFYSMFTNIFVPQFTSIHPFNCFFIHFYSVTLDGAVFSGISKFLRAWCIFSHSMYQKNTHLPWNKIFSSYHFLLIWFKVFNIDVKLLTQYFVVINKDFQLVPFFSNQFSLLFPNVYYLHQVTVTTYTHWPFLVFEYIHPFQLWKIVPSWKHSFLSCNALI